ncbi:MAG: hypothetical protein PHS46_07640 [Candidatus Omnitrophica bacterium]|nr:hypothetical protein [Candidatus Omnitrophota bacterium]
MCKLKTVEKVRHCERPKGAKQSLIFVSSLILCMLLFSASLYAFEQTITIPAESSQGTVLDLKKGDYIVKVEGGAITLCYPINPNYKWLIGVAVGTDVNGGQDYPNIGTLYFEPNPPAHSQTDAEEQAIKAVKENIAGTFLKFTLTENKRVRFWVSDYDYSDNSGMIKVKIVSAL